MSLSLYILPEEYKLSGTDETMIGEEINAKIGTITCFTSDLIERNKRIFFCQITNPLNTPIPNTIQIKLHNKLLQLHIFLTMNELIKTFKQPKAIQRDIDDKVNEDDIRSIELLKDVQVKRYYCPMIAYDFGIQQIKLAEEFDQSDSVGNFYEGDLILDLSVFIIGCWIPFERKFRPYWTIRNGSNPRLRYRADKKTLAIEFIHQSKRREGAKFDRRILIDFITTKENNNYYTETAQYNIYYLSLETTPICYERSLNDKQVKVKYDRVPWFAISNESPLAIYLMSKPVVALIMREKTKRWHGIAKEIYKCKELTIETVNPKAYPITLSFEIFKYLRFTHAIQYSILALISQGICSVLEITPDDLLFLKNLNDSSKVERVLQYMTKIPRENIKFIDAFIKYYNENLEEVIEADENLMNIQRVYLTPAFPIFRIPELDIANRVLRTYKDKIDYFIRVNIVTEKCEQMENVSEQLCKFYKEVLINGILVGERRYQFLGFSNSQLRGSSCWLFADTPALSIENIWTEMGDFSKEKVIAKYAARMGLPFSATYLAKNSTPKTIKYIKDIECNTEVLNKYTNCIEKPYMFSDGIGRISKDLIIDCIKVFNEDYASAIQCRFGGCKGVFSIDPNLSESMICIRNSQIKFKSDQQSIEVIGCSKFHYGHLNRQVIMLLSTLRIPNEVFINLLDENIKMLKDLRQGDGWEEIENEVLDGCFPEVMATVQQMLRSSFTAKNEPFLKSINHAIFYRSLKELRTKQRILIRESACLMGIMDELGILEYGQVFCRLSRYNNPLLENQRDFKDKNYVVTGKVIVSKNPCLFPGDIRVLTAIDKPELYHYVNVVVFPCKGKRPHPSETSGSDLDGDVYFISWNKLLIPCKNIESALFPSRVAEKSKGITRNDIINFFCNYLRGSNLGKIANAHLIHADQSALKALDPKCLYLAEQHAIEVDFPKTGVPGRIPKEYAIHSYPDFMEKENENNIYESRSIIGILYRRIKTNQEELSFNLKLDTTIDRSLIVNGFHEFYEEAELNYKRYANDVKLLMYQYGIKTEAELISGNVTECSKFHTVKKDKEDILERIEQSVKAIITKHKRIFEQNVTNKEAKASAYYIVTYDINKVYNTRKIKLSIRSYMKELVMELVDNVVEKKVKVVYFSFPWLIVGKILCRIKRLRSVY